MLERLRHASGELPPEEAALRGSLFPLASLDSYTFNAADYDWLCRAYREFRTTLDGITDPELVLPHLVLWYFGVAYSLEVPAGLILRVPHLSNTTSALSLMFCALWAALGASWLLAAGRVWPATLRKLASFTPYNRRPRRPLTLNDSIPVFLIGTAFMGFVFLAAATTTQFALVMVALVFVHGIALHLLEVPNAAGRKVLAELAGFREFLSRTDADRMNREHAPGRTPETLRENSAYAIALKVENAWGEEFADSVIELLRYEEAYDLWPASFLSSDREPIRLQMGARK